jgi:hypothetical protein
MPDRQFVVLWRGREGKHHQKQRRNENERGSESAPDQFTHLHRISSLSQRWNFFAGFH